MRFIFLLILRLLKKIFDWYINASLHVALATTALVQMTFYFCHIPFDVIVTLFVFCGTSASYNIIKYLPFILKNKEYKTSLKLIIALTILFLGICCVLFFQLKTATQIVTLLFCVLSIMYVVPFSKALPNLRNFAGIKIYIVSVCWAGVTILLPMLNADMEIGIDVVYKFLQRFILTLILILIFEIYDLKYDSSYLKTVPQILGVSKTKNLIYGLLIPFYILEFFKEGYYPNQWFINLLLCVCIALFTFFASHKQSKYYTVFWVESIPILWLLLVLIF